MPVWRAFSVFPADDLVSDARSPDPSSSDDEEELEEATVESLNDQYRRWLTFRRISDVVLLITELVGLVCVAWPAALQLQSGNGLTDVSNTRHLQTVRNKLIYYDEILTTSARLCALSGRKQFDDSYNAAVPPLEENLAEILELRPGQADAFNTTTFAANLELIRLETEALRGCATGPEKLSRSEAGPFVFGEEYELWKGDFTYGIQALRSDIDNFILDQRAESWEMTVYLWTVGIIVMMLLGLAQAVLHVQEEQSDKLAAEFEDLVDRVQRSLPRTAATSLPEEAMVLAAWGIEQDQKDFKVEVKDYKMKHVPSLQRLRTKRSKRGFWKQFMIALSPRGMVLPKKCHLSTSRMAADSLLLRRNMPRVVFLLHVISLGCLLTPPFIQLQTDGLVRMGHLLGEIGSLVDDIRYYDEVLTGSARLCALTGDIRWMVRYLQNVGNIDSAINNVVARQAAIEDKYPELQKQFGGNLGEHFLNTTDASNRRLIELETVVITNCTDAYLYHQDILFSQEYMDHKASLLSGLEKLTNDFLASVQSQEEVNMAVVSKQYTIIVVSLIVIRGSVGLMFAYYYAKLNWLDDKVKVGSIKKVIRDGKVEEDRNREIADRSKLEKGRQNAKEDNISGTGSSTHALDL